MALFDTRIASRSPVPTLGGILRSANRFRSTQDGRRPLSVAGHGLELCPGFHPGPGDQYRLLVSVFSKVQNVFVRSIPFHPAAPIRSIYGCVSRAPQSPLPLHWHEVKTVKLMALYVADMSHGGK